MTCQAASKKVWAGMPCVSFEKACSQITRTLSQTELDGTVVLQTVWCDHLLVRDGHQDFVAKQSAVQNNESLAHSFWLDH